MAFGCCQECSNYKDWPDLGLWTTQDEEGTLIMILCSTCRKAEGMGLWTPWLGENEHRDASARATLERMTTINDPAISEAMADLREE